MDAESEPVLDSSVVGQPENSEDVSQVESLNQHVDEIFVEVDQLERKLNEVEHFYSSSNEKHPDVSRRIFTMKDKEKEKFIANFTKRQQESAHRGADASRRKQGLMRQFENIFSQITQHKWATPFMKPVDVVGLGLDDYYEVIEKPMDFSTIQSKMDATDGTEYKNVREMCADVRLVFKNAMKYNDEKDDVHVMAKSLLDKFETKWLQLLPKVDEDEKLRKEEESVLQHEIQFSQGVVHAKMARDLSSELDKVDARLEELKEIALQNCRKMTSEEKKRLGSAITRLPHDDINKALEIIAQNDPTFHGQGDTVDVDIDAQSESTLWKLKLFVKDTMQAQMKESPKARGNSSNAENNSNGINRRKREICDALLIKNSQRKSKKFSTG